MTTVSFNTHNQIKNILNESKEVNIRDNDFFTIINISLEELINIFGPYKRSVNSNISKIWTIYFEDECKNTAFIYDWTNNKNKWFITGTSWKIVGYILEIIDKQNDSIKNSDSNLFSNESINNNSSDELSDEYNKSIKKSQQLLKKGVKNVDKKELKELKSENIRLKLKKSILEKLYHINNLHDLKYVDIFLSSLIQIEYSNE